MDYTMDYNELRDIIKEYGKLKGKVWFFNSTTRQKVLVKYDTTRRYFISDINGKKLYRVPQKAFQNVIEYLSRNEFYICF